MFDLSSLAKILPIEKIYTDLASRGFRQLGGLFEDYMKSIRLALPAVQLSAVEQDRFRRILEDPFFRVSPNYRTLPPSQLVGQILEGLRYEPEDTPIWEMFEQLMQRGCDRSRVGEAHPAFPGLIKQLCYDECILLRMLTKNKIALPYKYESGRDYVAVPPLILKEHFHEISFAEHLQAYAEHLESLGLITPLIGICGDKIISGPHEGFYTYEFHLRLNAFGKLFSTAILEHFPLTPVHTLRL